uniref:Uncharacterized protein n=1 Tax=mine drainage metagenome TaxID=410659 RepID=E6QIT8_9ZZZZ
MGVTLKATCKVSYSGKGVVLVPFVTQSLAFEVISRRRDHARNG